jgi:hypothetical protein
MSSIIVHVRLLSGDVLPVAVNAENGQVHFQTARLTLKNAVLKHVEKKENKYHVKFLHEDDEERCIAIRRDITNARFRRHFQRDATEEEYALWESSLMEMPFIARTVKDKLEESRVYHDGDMVTVLVEKAPHWLFGLEFGDSDAE